jgi:N-acetylglutamate synthase-like GNAT family acetyltransferase
MSDLSSLLIRSASDSDSQALIALIGAAFAEYPGCVLVVDDDMPELRAPDAAIRKALGRWWVAEDDDGIIGSVAIEPAADGAIELKKLYIAPITRRRGLGAHLVTLAESEARFRGAQTMILWTDTRFEDAHRLYERMGYRRMDATRELHDASNSIEYNFTKDLRR